MLPSPYLTASPPVATESARGFWPRSRVLLCFSAGLLGVVGLLHGVHQGPVFERPSFPELEKRLEWLAAHEAKYDTIFLGDSRIHEHINPALFDRLMAEGGVPTRSFNFGIGGAYCPEDTLFLELFLAQRRKPLRFVIVESQKTDPFFLERPDKKNTSRARFWQMRDILERSELKQRYDGFLFYVSDFFLAGRGGTLLRKGNKLPSKKSQELPEDYNGWCYQKAASPAINDRDWKKMQPRWAEMDRKIRRGLPADERELARKTELLRPFGARVFAIFPPFHPSAYFVPDLARHPGLTFFQFQDLAAYPEFFLRKNLADKRHFNVAGANFFTRKLAEKILKTR